MGDDSSSSMSDLEKGEAVEQQDEPTQAPPLNQECAPQVSATKEGSTITPAGMDWDGPEDPDNPQNWNLAMKVYHVTVPGLFGFAV